MSDLASLLERLRGPHRQSECGNFAEVHPDFLNELDIALTAAEAKAARMGEALKDVHRVLCDTRIAPSHLVGADIEWCIDHCRIGMQEPTP